MENESQSSPVPAPFAPGDFRVVAVGRAGIHAMEALLREGFPGAGFAAMHTDATTLARSSAPHRLHLGGGPARGLGAGGDPALGRAAAEKELGAIRNLVGGARVVFILTGLGAGTGSGAAPVVARIARESGALVLGVATLPFQCEGRLRQSNASAGLLDLRAESDAVLCVPNQLVLQTLDERTTAPDVFAAANDLLARGVRGLWQMLTRPGLIQLDFSNLERLLRGRHAESVFASVEARGEHRSREVVERLASHPFLGAGEVLAGSDAVLVNVSGGPDIAFAEIDRVLGQIQRMCEQAQVVVGTSVDEALAGRMQVTVVASRGGSAPLPEAQGTAPKPVATPAPSEPDRMSAIPGPSEFLNGEMGGTRASSRLVPPPPELSAAQRENLVGKGGRGPFKRKKVVQTTFNFDLVSKGRFEKTEPTILYGQDLDLPTYLRRGVALN